MDYYAGLDISMKETAVCIVDEKGKVVEELKVPSEPNAIAQYLEWSGLNIVKVGLESGSTSRWITQGLKKRGVHAVCVDARKMAALLTVIVNKTDKNDARGIAEAIRCNSYREVFLKSDESVETEAILTCRRLLVRQRKTIKNTVRGILKQYGLLLGSVTDKVLSQKVKQIAKTLPKAVQESLRSLLKCFETLIKEEEKHDKVVEVRVKNDKQVKRLMTIPGVGPITALAFKAEIDEPCRFKKSRQVGAYLGLTPRQYSSGEIHRQGRISKCGSREMRSLLNEAGVSILTRSKKWSRLKAWGMKIQKKHGFKKAAIAVGRKLAVIMHSMMIHEKDFEYGEARKHLEEKSAVA